MNITPEHTGVAAVQAMLLLKWHVNIIQRHYAAAAAAAPPAAAAVALKPDVFEGLRFEITRPLNQNFFLTHRCDLPGHGVTCVTCWDRV
jgi:hypothetical protein